MFEKGLVSVSFRDKTPTEICRAAVDAGLFRIEWGSDVHAPVNNTTKLHEIAELQAEFGIVCSSYGSYFRLGESDICELGSYITAAKTLGTNILRLWCGNRSSDKYTPTEREALFAECRAAAKIAEDAGVKLCMECHRNSFTETSDGMLELMHAVNSPAFLMYWQPNQFRTIDENIAYAKAAAPFTVNIHVFNWHGDDRLPLSGAVDCWQKYLKCFDGRQDLLLEFMPHGTVDELADEAVTLDKIVNGVI